MSHKLAAVRSASPGPLQPAPTEKWNEDAGASNVIYLWTSQMSRGMFFAMAKGAILSGDKSEVLQGALDMMIL